MRTNARAVNISSGERSVYRDVLALAAHHFAAGNYAEAEQLYRQVLAFADRRYGAAHPVTDVVRRRLEDAIARRAAGAADAGETRRETA